MATSEVLPDGLVPISRVAARLGVSIATVREWADSGALPSFRTPGGQRRFWRDDVEAFIAKRGAA